MEQKKFEAVLKLLIPQVIHLIAENGRIDEVTASRDFYNSKVYELLENEETKFWHFSPLTLFNMYNDEVKTGVLNFPEEA